MESIIDLETVLRQLRIQHGSVNVYNVLMKQLEEEYVALQQIFAPEFLRRALGVANDTNNFYEEYMRASAEAAKEVLNEIPRTNPELFECDESQISCDTYDDNMNIDEEELAINIVDDEEDQEIKIVDTEVEPKKNVKNATVNVVKEKAKRIKKKL